MIRCTFDYYRFCCFTSIVVGLLMVPVNYTSAQNVVHSTSIQQRDVNPGQQTTIASPIAVKLADKKDAFHLFELKKEMDRSVEIVLETRLITLDPSVAQSVYEQLNPASITIGSSSITGPDHADQPTTSDSITAATITSSARPSAVSVFHSKRFKNVIELVKGNTLGSLAQFPTITLENGASASINDATIRPFVVGIRHTRQNGTDMESPTIQSLEDGLVYKLSALGTGQQVQLRISCYHCKITDVKTFSFGKKNGNSARTIQLPTQEIKMCRVAQTVSVGESVLIDLFDQQIDGYVEERHALTKLPLVGNAFASTVLPPKRMKKPVSRRLMLTVTPRLIKASN